MIRVQHKAWYTHIYANIEYTIRSHHSIW